LGHAGERAQAAGHAGHRRRGALAELHHRVDEDLPHQVAKRLAVDDRQHHPAVWRERAADDLAQGASQLSGQHHLERPALLPELGDDCLHRPGQSRVAGGRGEEARRQPPAPGGHVGHRDERAHRRVEQRIDRELGQLSDW